MNRLVVSLIALLERKGIKVSRSYRYPQCTLNLLDVAVPALLLRCPKPVFVQVGASDGLTSDPLNALVKAHGLTGLLVEPLVMPFERLVANYASYPGLQFANVAIGETDGEIELHVPLGADTQIALSQKASRRAATTAKHVGWGCLETVRVRACTMSTLLGEHVLEHVDLLQVDVEGYDLSVIKQVFAMNLRPAVIHFESLHLSGAEMRECRTLLTACGYSYVETTVNTLATRWSCP